VLHSWLEASTLFGFTLTLAVPDGFEPDGGLFLAAEKSGRVRRVRDPREAVRSADVVYTDTWTSMGREADADWRRVAFTGYQVDEALLNLAAPGALFMHCLPAHRGEEVTAAVIDGPRSIVVEQAENKLHLQKSCLVSLVKRLAD
jgi:ornithine carbamoyltransferase